MSTTGIVATTIIAFYYLISLGIAFVPSLVAPDIQYPILMILSLLILMLAPLVLLCVIVLTYRRFKSYRSGVAPLKPTIIALLLLVSIIPALQIKNLIGFGNDIHQFNQQIDAAYSNTIPDATNTYLLIPTTETEQYIFKAYEPYFTEARTDGTMYVKYYKNKDEKKVERSLSRAYATNYNFLYPRSYIKIQGRLNSEGQTVADKPLTCSSLAYLGGEYEQCFDIKEEVLMNGNVTLVMKKSTQDHENFYSIRLQTTQGYTDIDFAEPPESVSVDTMLQIARSMVQ